jgi:hypothetical protein
MGDVIRFPSDEKDFKKIAAWIRQTCIQAGLTVEMADAVLDEYKDYHQKLFEVAGSKLAMPDGLTDAQVSQIGTTVREYHTKKLVEAAQIIIGLLARNQLDAG